MVCCRYYFIYEIDKINISADKTLSKETEIANLTYLVNTTIFIVPKLYPFYLKDLTNNSMCEKMNFER